MNTSKFPNIAQLIIRIGTIFALIAGLAINTSRVSAQDPTTFDCSNVTEIPLAECEALVAFYNSTSGAGWTNNTGWLQTNTPCSWYGVFCPEGHVTRLSLDYNNLVGTIPTEVGSLAYLSYLSMYTNQLIGPIPTEFGSLTNLTHLDLSSNQLSGSIPTELGNLTALTWLVLYGNQLTGSIPQEFRNLTQLDYLLLENNQLSGSIPPELVNLTQLDFLSLENNQLSGSIPPELGNFTNLKGLTLGGNQLTGSVPPELGDMTNLTYLGLRNNQLSGSIPKELGNLTELTSLIINDNQLTGSIPAELGNLTKLGELYLYNNQLTGTIPTELGNLTNLYYLWLEGNQLTGSIPTELGNLVNLAALVLARNKLSGEFPASITNLVKLNYLSFDCSLTSTDPAVIAFIEHLVPGWQTRCLPKIYSVKPNSGPSSGGLTVTLYGSYFTDTNMVTFGGESADFTVVSDSQISAISPAHEIGATDITVTTPYGIVTSTGAFTYSSPFSSCATVTQIPVAECEALVSLYNNTDGANWVNHTSWLQTSTPCGWFGITCRNGHVVEIYLWENNLSGQIAPELGDLTQLWWLTLSYNKLSGTIPVELGNLTNLIQLELSSNELSGTIPSELGGLTYLVGLRLDDNHLTGPIPPELGNFIHIQHLFLDNNQLTGYIPPQLGNLTSLWMLRLANNQLIGNIPPEIGNLRNLRQFTTEGNKLSGEIPLSIINLTNLVENVLWFPGLTLSCGLNSTDPTVISFLDQKSPGWQQRLCLNTPTGTNVTIAPETWLTIQFESVVQQGLTTAQIVSNPGNTPSGFQVVGNQYEVTTGSQFTSAKVCFTYEDSGLTPQQELGVRLFHVENNSWVDVSDDGYPDTSANIVCGTVTSFSPFAVVFALNQPPVADAGSDQTIFFGNAVSLDASASSGPDGDTLTYAWDLDNDGEYDDASGVTVTTSFNQIGDHTIGLRVTDAGGLSDTDTIVVTIIPWTLKGFYQPVDMNGVYNIVKNGSTVPLKFEIFAGSTELTDSFDIKSLTYVETACDLNAATDEVELTVTGSTSLRYDTQSGQFIYNWKTPNAAGKCYRVTMTAKDGSSLITYFKLK